MSEFLKDTVYPALYDRLPDALPEFGFVLQGDHYENLNPVKVTGEAAGSAGKVYVYENNPGRLVGYKASDISATIWDYLQARDRLTNGETFTLLCSLAGTPPPERELSPEALERLAAVKRREEALETLNEFFIASLHQGTAPAQKEARDYLEARGCNPATLRKPGAPLNKDKDRLFVPIEAGFIPSRDAAKQRLQEAGFTPEEIAPLFDGGEDRPPFFPRSFGTRHRLTFAIRDQGGHMAGFVSRALDSKTEQKYLLTSHERGRHLLNFHARTFDRHTKSAVIVEGVLDALFAGAAGLPNVFGLLGGKMSAGQIDLLKRAKISEVVLLFDADKGGEAGTRQSIDLFQEAGFAVFVARMPEGSKAKDLADLLQEPGGLEAARRIIAEAKGRDAWRYLFEVYQDDLNALEIITDADARAFAGKVAALSEGLRPFEREQLAAAFEAWSGESGAGLTRESLLEEAERLRFTREKERREKGLKKAMGAATGYLEQGDGEKALEALEKGLEATKKATGADLLPPYLTSREFIEVLKNKPPGLKTGWSNLDEFFRLYRGLVTMVGGRPSSGKTAAMLNLLYNLATGEKAGNFYYFAFEDNRENYLIKLLSLALGLDVKTDLGHADAYPGKGVITNQQFLEEYLKDTGPGRLIIPQVETAKDLVFDLLNSGKIQVIREAYTAEQLAAIFSHIAGKEPESAVFVDYVQRVQTEKAFRETVGRLEYVSNLINESAQKTGLAIIVGSQVNREGAGKEEKGMELLKGSGSMEEDAGAVLMITNLYKEGKTEEIRQGATPDNGRTVTGWKLTTTKNRYGKPDESAFFEFDQYTQKLTPTSNKGYTLKSN